MLNRILIQRFFSKSSTFKKEDKVKNLLQNAVTGNVEKDVSQENGLWSTDPYSGFSRDQSKMSRRPKKDPRETSIILFPGIPGFQVPCVKYILTLHF